jgi:hypothetical protein
MLEVILATVGSGIAGAARGYAASFNSKQPGRLFLGTALIALLGLSEAQRYQGRRKEKQGHIPGASSHLMDDTIIESSPTYLVDNFPLFGGVFAGFYTLAGSAATLMRRKPNFSGWRKLWRPNNQISHRNSS